MKMKEFGLHGGVHPWHPLWIRQWIVVQKAVVELECPRPGGGGNPEGVGVNLLFWSIFTGNCIKMNKKKTNGLVACIPWIC